MDPLFESHRLNPEGLRKAQLIAEAFDRLLAELELLCGAGIARGGREFALARTKLEEASFFAKKCMAILPENVLEQEKAKGA